MKCLLIIRHGKSSWENITLSDFERPLNARGLRNGPTMAQRLLNRKVRVDLLATSTAVRASATANMLAEALGQSRWDIAPVERLYHAAPATYLEYVQSINNAHQAVALVGHNPGITEWANQMGGLTIDNIPTLGMVYLEFERASTWQEIAPGTGRLRWYDYPKKPFPG